MKRIQEVLDRTAEQYNTLRATCQGLEGRERRKLLQQALRGYARYSAAFAALWRAEMKLAHGADRMVCEQCQRFYLTQAKNALADARIGQFEGWNQALV